jgi:uptake hydrogenase small subunit
MANVLWLQGGACSGNTMSFLNAQEPTVVELVTDFGVNILWHPSLGLEIGEQVSDLMNDLVAGKTALDILVYEGSIIEGPKGTGTMNYFADRPMKDWVKELAGVAAFVVAIGDCATWGGIPAVPPNPSESTGMQFHKRNIGGFLGAGYKSKGGLPVINIPGCPAHPDWVTQILVAISTGRVKDVLLDEFNRPKTFFTDFVQTGCTNAISFAQKIDGHFGKRGGCLFYEVGCRGPMTHASCNRILWNRQSSKTRANHPCLGCTEPGFPHNDLVKGSVFKTMHYLGFLPQDTPTGNSKLGYYMRAGIEKTLGAVESVVGVKKEQFESSK